MAQPLNFAAVSDCFMPFCQNEISVAMLMGETGRQHQLYARVLAHYPYVVLLAIFVVVVTFLILSTTVVSLPDFGNPMEGFEPRGTEIGARLTTYENLLDNADGKLTLLPIMFDTKVIDNMGGVYDDGFDEYNDTDEEGFVKRSTRRSSYFCKLPPGRNYQGLARIVFRSADGGNLLSAERIRYMCQIEQERIVSHSSYPQICERDDENNCCRSWSLGHYVTFLTRKDNCSQIDDRDVEKVSNLLITCSGYYHNGTLTSGCRSEQCSKMPRKCRRFNAVYNLLHYITDVNFLNPNKQFTKGQKPFLHMAVTFLPARGNPTTIQLYKHIEEWAESLEQIRIIGVNFGIKYTLFSEYLKSDTVWLIVAASVIFCIMWLYCASLFITVMTFLMMFWSLELAYFLYMIVFEVNFFPYMNLVTAVIVIAIGADDVFIYSKVWHLAKSEPNNGTLEKIISDTLKHATLSMFVTSLTTASALFTNTISSISAIKCFSIYAGTTVICNFVLVVTWLPASIIIYEKWCNCEMWYNPELQTSKSVCYYLCKVPHKVYSKITDFSRTVFEKIMPFLVIKLKFAWILLFGALGIGGIIVIFYSPKLRLPSSEKFQVFSSDHLFEHYDFVLSKQFFFEREQGRYRYQARLPLTVIWGVLPKDNGNKFNPKDGGTLEYDYSFDPTTITAQLWLLKFCKKLRTTDFYWQIPGFQFTNCFFEEFQNLMQRQCKNDLGKDYTPCCNATAANPLHSRQMILCLQDYIPDLMRTPGVHYNYYSPGPRFHNGKISAFIIQFLSNQSFSFSHNKMKSFYENVNQWVTDEMRSAPKEIRNGWFVSDLAFYDLQRTLLHETPVAFAVSLIVVAIVSFLTTLNLLISFLAIISIAFVMFTTVGTLVLLGWELNILESVVITVAIGMSVDYTLHYGVSYRLSPEIDRETRVATSTARLGSVIAMAALTTFLAGAMMMPSTVLVYQKFGIFLMLIISTSWSYSTFFFQSLLCVFGPRGGFSQFHWPSCDCCSISTHDRRDKTVYSTSESTMSTSSSYHHTTSSEGRELDPLTESYEYRAQHSQHRRSSRSRGQYVRTHTRSDSPEPEVRRGSRVRFSIGSIERTGSVCEEESSYIPPCRSRAESEVFHEDEEIESPPSPTDTNGNSKPSPDP